MNEITTEERLRIVEELNRTANDSLGGESLQRALARITGADDTSWTSSRAWPSWRTARRRRCRWLLTASTTASPAATTAGPTPRAA